MSMLERLVSKVLGRVGSQSVPVDSVAFQLYDVVSTYRGQGVICSIEHSYEGMPYAVAFPDTTVDFFEPWQMTLRQRSHFIGVPRKIYLAYNRAA